MRSYLIRVAKRIARRIIGRPMLGKSILVYHRVARANFDPWNLAVTPEEFEQQLTSLRKKIVLPLSEFVSLQHRRRRERVARIPILNRSAIRRRLVGSARIHLPCPGFQLRHRYAPVGQLCNEWASCGRSPRRTAACRFPRALGAPSPSFDKRTTPIP